MHTLILFIVTILLSALLISLIVLNVTGRFKFGGPFTAYPFLTLLPILLLSAPIAVLVSFAYLIEGKVANTLLICLLTFEILAFAVFLYVRMNVLPGSFAEKQQTDKKLLQKDYGKRLLHYALYMNILYLIPTITAAVFYALKFHNELFYVVSHPLKVIEYILAYVFLTVFIPFITFPITIILIACSIVLAILCLLIFLTFTISLNGTIRLIIASDSIRKYAALHIVLMFLPLFNIVDMFFLCHKVKKESKNQIIPEVQYEHSV